MTGHVVPVRVYVGIFAALLVLTALTVGVAFVDLGPLNTIVAVSIAVVKAMLVILWFMHVRYSDHLTWIVVAGAFLWAFILIAFTMAEVMTRGWMGFPGI